MTRASAQPASERQRQAGVLLHPTSLPNGCLDHQAWRFLDWMAQAGLRVWQMLPLSEPVQGLSPYQSLSAFALNPALLPPHWQQAFDQPGFDAFCQHPPHWLEDYALFRVLRQVYDHQAWSAWPVALRDRDPEALSQFAKQHAQAIKHIKQEQYHLLGLMQQLKKDANARGIALFGDVPIFVAYDSADVWAHPEQFRLDRQGQPTVVTGVPPDYFSETGQRWGNPHYDWDQMQADGFDWWHKRMQQMQQLFDWVRIDHFRGLESSWEIQADEPTAIEGRWVKAPGHALLQTLKTTVPDLNWVAEDLGVITPEVVALKEAFELPGMSVLQFGFDGLPDNPHALGAQTQNTIVYTGTHDNNTTLGWWQSLTDEGQKSWILHSLADYEEVVDVNEPMPWPMIAAAFATPARLAMVPMQDFLGLDQNSRMNTPGTIEANWHWQLEASQLTQALSVKIKQLAQATTRIK